MKLSGGQWAAISGAIVVVAGGVAWWFLRDTSDGVDLNDPSSDEEPTSPDSPSAAAVAAGVALPVYCLARATASEEGGEPRLYQQAVACAILNFARAEHPELGDDDAVVRLVLGMVGVFGRQGSGGRRVSSARVPASSQLAIAADVLAGRLADPTGGATQFDSPAGQRALLARGDTLTKHTPEEIADQRLAAGYDLVAVPGIDPDRLRFWRRA